ncbi:MAG: hypothetical protein R8M38_03805 [Mariprofundaceae bacterium]
MSRRNQKSAKPFDRQKLIRQCFRVSTWVILTVCIMGGGMAANTLLTVTHWKVTGSTPHLHAQIETELASMNLDFIHTSPAEVRKLLIENIADLANAEVERKLPDMLYIRAIAEEPVALWQQQKAVWILGQSGHAYRQLKSTDHLNLPLVRASASLLPEAVRMLQSLKRQDAFRFGKLSECIAMVEADSWQFLFDQRQSWLLTQGGQGEQQMNRLIATLHKKRWRGGQWRVDARLEKRWFFRQAYDGGVI